MLKVFKADLHIHTCLSPCSDLEMSPQNIAQQARSRDIAVLGICDHNSAENTPALMEAGRRFQLCVLPGLEVTSEEEVHVLALFDRVEAALDLQRAVYSLLPGENDAEAFGTQAVVNVEGEVLEFNSKLLIGATELSLEEVVRRIHLLEGLAIASHIDRESFSLLGQLGFIPKGLDLDALEVSPRMTLDEARAKFDTDLPLVTASDAHFLKDIGAATTAFFMESGTVAEIKKALRRQGGRRLIH
jgi:predicted metal-dependent phosphoesterase TrpH